MLFATVIDASNRLQCTHNCRSHPPAAAGAVNKPCMCCTKYLGIVRRVKICCTRGGSLFGIETRNQIVRLAHIKFAIGRRPRRTWVENLGKLASTGHAMRDGPRRNELGAECCDSVDRITDLEPVLAAASFTSAKVFRELTFGDACPHITSKCIAAPGQLPQSEIGGLDAWR